MRFVAMGLPRRSCLWWHGTEKLTSGHALLALERMHDTWSFVFGILDLLLF